MKMSVRTVAVLTTVFYLFKCKLEFAVFAYEFSCHPFEKTFFVGGCSSVLEAR